MTSENANIVVDLVSRLGLPVLLILAIVFVAIKYFIPTWQKQKESEQRSIEERNRTYAEQAKTSIQIAEQGNLLAKQCSTVIELNTEVIKNNTEMHKDVKEALARDLEATRDVACALKEHEKMAYDIKADTKRLLDKMHD